MYCNHLLHEISGPRILTKKSFQCYIYVLLGYLKVVCNTFPGLFGLCSICIVNNYGNNFSQHKGSYVIQRKSYDIASIHSILIVPLSSLLKNSARVYLDCWQNKEITHDTTVFYIFGCIIPM